MIRSPVRQIVAAIDAASARWRDAAFEPRLRARNAAAARTGYSLASIDYAFDRIFESVRREAIEAVIADELGSMEALDDFVPRSGRSRTRALPIGSVCIVSSRTTVGVAIVPMVFALCAKCDTLVKDREDHLAAAFLETALEQLPPLRGHASAQTWSGEGGADLSSYDAVVAFGNDATLAQIAAELPSRIRFIPYGSKASAGYITREALYDETAARAIARGAARDLTLYESEGCLSLHALFVENGSTVSAQRFGELLAEEMRAASQEFSPAAADEQTAARRAMARDLAAFRSQGRPLGVEGSAASLVLLDPPLDEPPLFLARTIGIRCVDGSAQAAEYLERHGITLEGFAVAGSRDDVLELAVRVKAARVVPFGTLQAPPLGAFHGGRARIADFVRWIGDET